MEAGDSDLYFKAGNDNMVKENYEDAILNYDKAIEINPSFVSAWNNKGIALSRLKRYEDAINCYDKAIAIEPRHANAWYNKAKAYRDMGQSRLDKANEDRTRAAKLINESLVFFDTANECYDKGDALSKEQGQSH
ncbi:MAG TPA: tetratricopeptide repeat protein [Candidatus Bathyarchaeia archaeon]|nr:tetratricopeptide repeat protein [Candidatus Bathyarchaeia archaeon]